MPSRRFDRPDRSQPSLMRETPWITTTGVSEVRTRSVIRTDAAFRPGTTPIRSIPDGSSVESGERSECPGRDNVLRRLSMRVATWNLKQAVAPKAKADQLLDWLATEVVH